MKKSEMAALLAGSISAIFQIACASHLAAANLCGANRIDRVENRCVVTGIELGQTGGELRFAQRSGPRTLNPLVAIDADERR